MSTTCRARSVDRARQVVDIYRSGGELEFSFAAYRAPKIESSREATLSIPLGGYDVVLHDADKKQLAIYHFLQPPQRLAALEVRGGPKRVEIAWRTSAECFVIGYRIYAATERDCQDTRIAESKEADLSFEVDPLKAFTHYRVGAVTRLDVEGEPSAPVEDLFRAAFRLFDGGKYDAALTGFERAAKSAPEHPAHIEYLGRTLLALGKHEAALARFQDLARRPGFETVGRQLEARALAAGGDILGARAVIERAVATNQADAVTYTLCADFSLMLADPAGAVRCADTALEREPTNAHARAMRGEALARYARVLEIAPRDAEALLASANIHLALGELDKARTIALSLVGSPAQESRGQYVLGRIALKQEKADEAVIAFARATKLDAKNGPGWAGLAEAYLALKDERKARDALAAAAALPDAGAAVYRQLAELEIKGGRPAQAVAPLERAIVFLPGDYQLRLVQARTLATLDRWHDVANSAREAQKLEPKSIEALLLGAEAAYRQGKNGDAIEML